MKGHRPSSTPLSRIIKDAVLLACMAASSTVAVAQEGPPLTRERLRLTSADLNRPASYAIGDKLKITVFEQLYPDTGQDGGDKRDIVASSIERPELSGEYIVQEDGNIYVPLAGSTLVAGKSFQELDRALSTALSSRLDGPVRVAIQLADREPVYVLGPVARPGPYKYVPGMRVLHAMALAGAIDIAPQDNWRLLDTARERERLLKSSARMTRALARIAVLAAERDGTEPSPRRLVELVGQTAAKARLGEANAFRAVERGKRKRQEAAIDAAIQSHRAELEIQRNKVAQVQANLGDRRVRLENLVRLRERGATTDASYYTSLLEMGDAKERAQDARGLIAQTESRISVLQQDLLRLAVEVDIEREKEIRDLQTIADEEELTRAAVSTALAQLPIGFERQSAGRRATKISVLRRTPTGMVSLAADDASALEPGDVVQITFADTELAVVQ